MRRLAGVAVLVAVAGLAGKGLADDKATATGTWKWTVEFGDQKREQTLKLKQDGTKLTGHLVGRNNMETPIEDGTVKGGEVSFQITRERDGNKMVIKFKGKVTGDTLKGKVEFDRGGETQSMDWDAKREKS